MSRSLRLVKLSNGWNVVRDEKERWLYRFDTISCFRVLSCKRVFEKIGVFAYHRPFVHLDYPKEVGDMVMFKTTEYDTNHNPLREFIMYFYEEDGKRLETGRTIREEMEREEKVKGLLVMLVAEDEKWTVVSQLNSESKENFFESEQEARDHLFEKIRHQRLRMLL